jgi:3'(2'), 5'-bisphosphate nucleotidase
MSFSFSHDLLPTALTAVGEACLVARHIQQQIEPTKSLRKSDNSPVTVADFAVQAILAQRLTSLPGSVPIVGEENSSALRHSEPAMREAILQAVQLTWKEATENEMLQAIDTGTHNGSACAYWALDPIDGTKGFIRGGQYAISLAYIDHGVVVLGIMGCPNLSADFARPFSDPDPTGLIYFATQGGGAWVMQANDPHGQPQSVKPVPVDPQAPLRICESVEPGHSKHDATARVIKALGGCSLPPIRLDSQCKYAIVARGQADAYLRLPTRADYIENIWDHAAGMVIAIEAGVIVTDIDGRPLDFSHGRGLSHNRGVICASPRYHRRIIEAIKRFGVVGQ